MLRTKGEQQEDYIILSKEGTWLENKKKNVS
jgi:hypothetical protein